MNFSESFMKNNLVEKNLPFLLFLGDDCRQIVIDDRCEINVEVVRVGGHVELDLVLWEDALPMQLPVVFNAGTTQRQLNTYNQENLQFALLRCIKVNS